MDAILPFIMLPILVLVAMEAIYIIHNLFIAHELGKKFSTCSQYVNNPQKRILVVGDSIALGTGAREYRNTLAGRIATDYPTAEVINLSENAASTKQIIKRINDIPNECLGYFDIVIIKVGGMDILKFKSIKKAGEMFRELLDITTQKLCPNGRIILVSPGNVGGMKLWRHFPIGVIYSWQSKRFHDELSKIALEKNIRYVDLYTHPKNDPWGTNPSLLAKDLIHPNDEGYGLLYEYVKGSLIH